MIKHFFILIVFLLALATVVHAQTFPVTPNGTAQVDVVKDTAYYQFNKVDSIFYEVREVKYINGNTNVWYVPLGDTSQFLTQLGYRNIQIGDQSARTMIAAARIEQARRTIERNEAHGLAIAGVNIQQYLSQALAAQITGIYEATRKVGNSTKTDACTIELSNKRLKVTVPSDGAYSVIIYAKSWLRLEKGSGTGKVTEDLLEYKPGLYRNIAGTFTLRLKKLVPPTITPVSPPAGPRSQTVLQNKN